jgi:hypothetical protein
MEEKEFIIKIIRKIGIMTDREKKKERRKDMRPRGPSCAACQPTQIR